MIGWAYIRRMVLAAAAFVLCMAAFNALIDPYGLFGLAEVQGLNAKKAYAHNHTRLAKESRAERLQPRTVVIGNSRVDVGFDPLSAEWPADMRPVANLGIPGDGIDGGLASLRFVLRETQATTIVLGLDFTDFLWRSRMGASNSASESIWQSAPQTLLSLKASADSVLTVLAQQDPLSTAMTGNGFNPMRDHTAIVAREGHFALAEQKNRRNLEGLLARPATVFYPDGRLGEPMRQLEQLLAEAAKRKVRVVAFVYPFHAEFLQLIDLTGRGAGYRHWKQAVAGIFNAHASAQAHLDWALWDFGVYAGPTMEPIPAKGDHRGRMHWWWEPGHYKAALGDLMLRRMFGQGADFGIALHPETTVPHLNQQAALASQFRAGNRQTIRNLLDLCPAGACATSPNQKQALRL